MRRSPILVAAAVLSLGACSDNPTLLAPEHPVTASPAATLFQLQPG